MSNHKPSPAPPATNNLPTASSSAAGTKRKREEVKFYAVRTGHKPGIYYTWADCFAQVQGFPRASFKSFKSLSEANQFIADVEAGAVASSGRAAASNPRGDKFYAVKIGRKPGVYESWPEVLEQITGWKNPRHKSFKTKQEAEAFIAEGAQDAANGGVVAGSSAVDGAPEKEVIAELNPPSSRKSKSSKSGSSSNTNNRKSNGALRDDPFLTDPNNPSSLESGEYIPGEGPLPEGAEDNFDPTITLDHALGTARYKNAAELSRTKYQAVNPLPTSAIKIYTDGSALGNGQTGAIAGVGVYFGPRDGRNISEPLQGTKQTNQRAELTALHRALEVAPRDRRAILFSDSQYAIKCVTEWFVTWRRNGWTNAAGKPVENKDLVVKIVDMLEERRRLNRHLESSSGGSNALEAEQEEKAIWGMNGVAPDKLGHWTKGPAGVHFQWVKGHAKDVGNEAADELAVQGAAMAKELNADVVL